MAKKLEHYVAIAASMVAVDKKRDEANKAYDRMDHNEWDLPSGLQTVQWIRRKVNTGPSTDIATAIRVLASMDENSTIQQLERNLATKKKVNGWERSLKWMLMQANRRRQGPVRQTLVRSAVKYDEIVAQVVDLDYQIAQKDIFGGDTQREKAARQHYGRFIPIIYHPNDVHVRYSNLMPEAVLLRQIRTAQSVRDEWGDKANRRSDLKEMAEKGENVVYNDYIDYHDHVIWCEPVTETGEAGQFIQIVREEHKLPFFPWVTEVGGDTMERLPEHR